MTRIFITMLPDGGNQNYVYKAGDLNVVVNLDRNQKASDSYSFFLYNSQQMLIDMAQTGPDGTGVERSGCSLRLTLKCKGVWLAGDYFLLMRSGAGAVQRFDLRLDDGGRFRVSGMRFCHSLSEEDMLSGRLCNQRAVWKRLSNRPGGRQLKAWAMHRAMMNELNAKREKIADAVSLPSNLLIACRSEGWRAFAALEMKHVGQLQGDLKLVDCATLFNPTNANPYEELHNTFPSHDDYGDSLFDRVMTPRTHCVYAFFHIGALIDSGGKNLLRTILRHWPDSGFPAIFIGTQQEIDELLSQNPSLKAYFPQENRLAEEPFTREEVFSQFFSEVDKAHLTLLPEARERLSHMVSEAYDQGLLSNWTVEDIHQYVSERLKPAYLEGTLQRMSAGTQKCLLHQVTAADVSQTVIVSEQTGFSEAMAQLNGMVGLKGLKESLATLSNRMRFYVERRRLGLRTKDGATFHALFTGNPGTGKTTVARLLGRVYHSLGLLSKGEVVCVDRQRMIGRYIGETEENMKMILQEARGNVLFVDEAYTLFSPGDERDYGRHALEALLDVLARPNPDMLIILAGYEREMNQLMQMNPGMPGRFPYRFSFPDYTADELLQIACRLLEAEDYVLSDAARRLLQQGISETVARRTEKFANARWAEQLVRNGIVPAMADRVARQPRALQRDSYRQVEEADVAEALSRFNSKTIEMKQRRTIGFCA